MLTFAYPDELADHVHQRWSSEPHRHDAPPLDFLRHLLGLIYHASFLTDESRPVHMSICCTPGREALDTARETPLDVIEFERPRALTVSELRKLSSAFEPLRSAAWVSYRPDSPRGQICGVLDIDPSWHYAHLGLSYGFEGMPNALVASSFGPGHLVVLRGNEVLGSLQAGELTTTRPAAVQALAGLQHLFDEGLRRLCQPREGQAFALKAYTNVVLGVVNLIEATGHGGALVFASQSDRESLNSRIQMKYELKNQRGQVLQDRFLEFLDARRKLGEIDPHSPGSALARREAVSGCELTERKLSQTCEFIARLAGVDGALVLETDLTLLGFGAEIRTVPDPHVRFYRALDSLSPSQDELDMEEFGMRHRSAAFLCSRLSSSGVFVTSQDRGVTLVWKREDGCCHVLQHVWTKGNNMER